MIEVENKFAITKEQEKTLTADAELISEKRIEDVYYDTPDFSLTTNDIWLRKRNGAFDIKTPTGDVGGRAFGATSYKEHETEEEVRGVLKLDATDSLEEDLLSAGYVVIAEVIKNRKSYKEEGFRIDIDNCEYGFEMAEIEMLVATEEEKEGAFKKIEAFALSKGIERKPVHGTLLEYLRRFKPEHFATLKEHKII